MALTYEQQIPLIKIPHSLGELFLALNSFHRKKQKKSTYGEQLLLFHFIWYRVRPCVSIRLSEFRVISGKCTGKTDNRKTNILVHFRFDSSQRQGFPFENTKMVRKFSRNRLTKMFETPVLIFGRSENKQKQSSEMCPQILKILKFPVKTQYFCICDVCLRVQLKT